MFKYLSNSSTVNLAIRKILNVGMAILPLFIFYVIHVDVVYPNPKGTNKKTFSYFLCNQCCLSKSKKYI